MSRTSRMASGCWAARAVAGPEVGGPGEATRGWAEAVGWHGPQLLAPGVLSFVLQLPWALGGGASGGGRGDTASFCLTSERCPSPGCGKWSWAGGRRCW